MFGNANLRVDNHKKDYISTSVTRTGSVIPVMEGFSKKEMEKDITKNVEDKLKKEKLDKSRGDIAANVALTESVIPRICNKITEAGKEAIFMDIMADMYYESVYLNEEFKEEHRAAIREFAMDYIKSNGGYKMLLEACKSTKSPVLEKIKGTCEKCASRTSIRKGKEMREACAGKRSGAKAAEVAQNQFEFDMNDEELKQYRKEREKISEEQIIDFVRGKVLDVVKDEQERQQANEKFNEELTAKAAELSDDENRQKAYKESTMARLMGNCQTDMTLFEAIQVSSLKEAISGVNDADAIGTDLDDFIDDNDTEDDDDFILDDDEIFMEGTQPKLDMDEVFSEAISKYTMLELCFTLNLESFSRDKVQKMCLALGK